jgi:hypothetical protein
VLHLVFNQERLNRAQKCMLLKANDEFKYKLILR